MPEATRLERSLGPERARVLFYCVLCRRARRGCVAVASTSRTKRRLGYRTRRRPAPRQVDFSVVVGRFAVARTVRYCLVDFGCALNTVSCCFPIMKLFHRDVSRECPPWRAEVLPTRAVWCACGYRLAGIAEVGQCKSESNWICRARINELNRPTH